MKHRAELSLLEMNWFPAYEFMAWFKKWRNFLGELTSLTWFSVYLGNAHDLLVSHMFPGLYWAFGFSLYRSLSGRIEIPRICLRATLTLGSSAATMAVQLRMDIYTRIWSSQLTGIFEVWSNAAKSKLFPPSFERRCTSSYPSFDPSTRQFPANHGQALTAWIATQPSQV